MSVAGSSDPRAPGAGSLPPCRVLVTGAGAPGGASILESLAVAEEREVILITGDCDPAKAGTVRGASFHTWPRATDPGFVDALLAVARAERVQVILPIVTRELIPLARRRREFDEVGCTVLVSPAEALEIANDKRQTIEALAAAGLDVPDTVVIRRGSEFASAARSVGYPARAVCFKPSVGNGARGFRVVDPAADWRAILLEQKPSSVHLRFEHAREWLESLDPLPEMIVCEYLAGMEYSVDILADRGTPICILPRRRDEVMGGLTGRGELVDEPDIAKYSQKVVELLGLHGNIGVQLRRDASGRPKILEINPRLQGTCVLCTAAGVNLPYLGVKLALGEPLPHIEPAWGTRVVRGWQLLFSAPDGQPIGLRASRRPSI